MHAQTALLLRSAARYSCLRVYQRRRIQLEQQLPFLDRVAGRVRREFFDPAVDTRVHVLQRVLVVADVAHGLDMARQRAAFRYGGANAEVVDDRRVDRHDAGRGVDLIRVHGHEVHAHRRLAGLVAPVVRVHRRNPVEDFASPSSAAASSGCGANHEPARKPIIACSNRTSPIMICCSSFETSEVCERGVTLCALDLKSNVFETCIEIVDVPAHDVGEVAGVALVSEERRLRLSFRLFENQRFIECQATSQVHPACVLGVELALEASGSSCCEYLAALRSLSAAASLRSWRFSPKNGKPTVTDRLTKSDRGVPSGRNPSR